MDLMQTHAFGRSEAEFSCILSQSKEYSIDASFNAKSPK